MMPVTSLPIDFYDKSEMGNVSDAYLKSLVAEIAKH